MITYSKLSKLQEHPRTLSENKSFLNGLQYGNGLETFLFYGEDAFYSDFHAQEQKITVTDKVKKILKKAYQRIGDENFDKIFQDENKLSKIIYECARDTGYGLHYKFNTLIDKIMVDQEGYEYLLALDKSDGKELISKELHEKIVEGAETLISHPFTEKYFKDYSGSDRIEVIYQVPVVFDIEGFNEKGKAIFDIIVLDHKEKKILPVDLKTISTSPNEFPYNFIRKNYYLQSAFYTDALIADILTGIQEDYEILPFRFVVSSNLNPKYPIIFTCSENDIHVGRYGGKTTTGYRVKGWRQLLDDLVWHRKNDKWDYEAEVYRNNGEQVIDAFI